MNHFLPHPVDARRKAGLTTRALRKVGGFSLATIRACERDGRYPLNQSTRKCYLAALGLPDGEGRVLPRSKP